MSSELAVQETHAVTISGEQKELIRKTICKDATDAEMQLFFFDCQRRGTHPLDKLIHFTKRDGKYTPVTSIDFFRLRAHSSGAYAGEGATTYELAEDGLPDSCTVAVLRLVQGQLCTWRATARWSEYYPGEKSGFMWKKMPFLMLAKCAEALALRKAFPAELQGLYVKEEMDQAGGVYHKPLQTGAEMLAKLEDKATNDGLVKDVKASETASPVIQDDSLPQTDNVFAAASAVADYEAVIADATGLEDLQKTWDEVTKDQRIDSAQKAGLWNQYNAMVKKMSGRK